jgi:hypothetical protein
VGIGAAVEAFVYDLDRHNIEAVWYDYTAAANK